MGGGWLDAFAEAAFAPASSQPPQFHGPFNAESLTFYVVHEGGDLTLSLQATRKLRSPNRRASVEIPQAIFVQVYDANEFLVTSKYHPFPKDDTAFHLPSTIPNAPAGIYQIRATGSWGGGIQFDLETSPVCSFGVMAARDTLKRTTAEQFSKAFLYIPEHRQSLTFKKGSQKGALKHADGTSIGTFGGGKEATFTELPANSVCEIELEQGTGWIGMKGTVPLILCPDEKSALAIKGSLVTDPISGDVYEHAFQVRMKQWISHLTAKDLQVEYVPISSRKEAWLADPGQAHLIGSRGLFSHVKYLLEHQNTDPFSPEFGDADNLANLAGYYAIKGDFNPYYQHVGIKNRLLLQQFKTLLKLKENGTFHDSWDNYSGGDALHTLSTYCSFWLMAKDIPANERLLWQDGISRLINRFAMSRVSCENQSSHWLSDLYMYYLGSGDETYKQLALDFAEALADPEQNSFMQTGYAQERYGPDAGYQGLFACNLAFYYRLSQDPHALVVLKQVYSLFNHTVAPESDGEVFGSTQFSHRTQASWVDRQWGGGLALMAGILPEANCWIMPVSDAETKEELLANFNWAVRVAEPGQWYKRNSRWATGYAMSPWMPMWYGYMLPARSKSHHPLPAESKQPFVRRFGDEFLAVKQGAYFANVYVGKTSGNWVRRLQKSDPIKDNWALENGTLSPKNGAAAKDLWMPSQGLGQFWKEGTGTIILAKNWNAYTGYFVRADLTDGKVAWADYWTAVQNWQESSQTQTLTNQLFDTDMECQRQLVFGESGIRVNLNLQSASGLPVKRLIEQIPLLKKDGMSIRFQRNGIWMEQSGEACTSVAFDYQGHTCYLEFERPVSVGLGYASTNHHQTIMALEIDLIATPTTVKTAQLSYTIR